MSFAKYKKQLQREIGANPGKAGVLALLLAVALYFWAPLVMKWFGGPASAPPDADVAEQETPSAGTQTDGTAATRETPSRPAWTAVAEWIEKDAHTKPVLELKQTRDPFLAHVERIAAEEEKQEVEEVVVRPAVTPESLGLEVTSTIVGTQRRTAVIDGRAYAEGRRVIKQAGEHTFVFELAEVHPRHVVLMHDDHRFELKIKRSDFAVIETVDEPN